MCAGGLESALRSAGFGRDYLAEVGARQWPVLWSNYQNRKSTEGETWRHAPSSEEDIETALDLAQVQPGETVIDLGSGSGEVLLRAAKRGCRAIGIERDARYVNQSRRRVFEARVSDLVDVRLQDIGDANLSEADVIYVYLSPEATLALTPKLARLREGVCVISRMHPLASWGGYRHGDLYLYSTPLDVQPLAFSSLESAVKPRPVETPKASAAPRAVRQSASACGCLMCRLRRFWRR